ncbi:hypothetical protein HPB51_007177 [Rhipicephalus microplus]|uniref:Uncharacterized protein n=1 Tax=Rhipicephalus microplus TaxID=6941 RepID=A0A9J6DZF9_RHIMP|nr:hypothetical protein HPB51_007177 [Rhipicephalus microplus]
MSCSDVIEESHDVMVLAQAQGELQEERRRLLSGISSLLSRCRNVLPESSLPGIQEDRVLLRELESLRDDLEGRLRDYARKLDGNLSLSKESLSKSRSGYLSCNVSQMNDVLSVPIGSIGNGLCSQSRYQSEYGDYNGRNPWGSAPQDDQIPVRDVGPLAQSARCHGSSPESSLAHFSNSCVLQDVPPTCSTPLSTPKLDLGSLGTPDFSVSFVEIEATPLPLHGLCCLSAVLMSRHDSPPPLSAALVEQGMTFNPSHQVADVDCGATRGASREALHACVGSETDFPGQLKMSTHSLFRLPLFGTRRTSLTAFRARGERSPFVAPLRTHGRRAVRCPKVGKQDTEASFSRFGFYVIAKLPPKAIRYVDHRRIQCLSRVVNQWGPMTKLMRPTSSHTQSPVKQEHQLTVPEGIEERLRNMESHLKLKSGCAVPHDVYARLKQLEDRILYLEGISPDYFSTTDWSLAQIESRIDLLKSRLREKTEASSEPSTSSMAL